MQSPLDMNLYLNKKKKLVQHYFDSCTSFFFLLFLELPPMLFLMGVVRDPFC